MSNQMHAHSIQLYQVLLVPTGGLLGGPEGAGSGGTTAADFPLRGTSILSVGAKLHIPSLAVSMVMFIFSMSCPALLR